MTVELQLLSADDVDGLATRFELIRDAQRVDLPYDPPPSRVDAMAVIEHPFPGEEQTYWLVRAGGNVVGAVSLHLPILDNLENATIDLIIHPDHRRQGFGTEVVGLMAERVTGAGRRRIIAEVSVDGPDLPSGPRGHVAFAESCGAKLALVETRRRLDLTTISRDQISALLAEAGDASADYHLVPWVGRVPDDVIDGVAVLESRMVEDAPMGDLAWEPEVHDATRWRATEATVRGRGRRAYGCASVHSPSGEITGFTIGVVAGDVPEHAWQWTTIVLPQHRGHRLGLRLKTYALLELLRHEPQLLAMDTWNAEVNEPMIAVNERMGYRPVDIWAECQLELG